MPEESIPRDIRGFVVYVARRRSRSHARCGPRHRDAAFRERRERHQPQVARDAAAVDAALELLQHPRLLDVIVDDFERCGVVGEETNKLVGYLAAVSRKLEEPLAVLIQSSSAAGKSSLMEAVLAFVPDEERASGMVVDSNGWS